MYETAQGAGAGQKDGKNLDLKKLQTLQKQQRIFHRTHCWKD